VARGSTLFDGVPGQPERLTWSCSVFVQIYYVQISCGSDINQSINHFISHNNMR